MADSPRSREVAILFPSEMSLYEPLEVDQQGRHRMDLLGWYAQFLDLGWHVDILHPVQIAAGALAHYRILVVPHYSLYDLGDQAAMEAAVKEFVTAGGTVVHGPHCDLAGRALEIQEYAAPFDCIAWREKVIPHGWSTVAYQQKSNQQVLATYIQSAAPAIIQTTIGRGCVFSFGFQYGYSYCRRTMPIVPPQYGRLEMHPVVLLRETPVAAIIGSPEQLPIAPMRGVEFARFGPHLIIVNHRSSPVDISGINARSESPQIPSDPGTLAAHSASCVTVENG
jgi:hypothetical protein